MEYVYNYKIKRHIKELYHFLRILYNVQLMDCEDEIFDLYSLDGAIYEFFETKHEKTNSFDLRILKPDAEQEFFDEYVHRPMSPLLRKKP